MKYLIALSLAVLVWVLQPWSAPGRMPRFNEAANQVSAVLVFVSVLVIWKLTSESKVD